MYARMYALTYARMYARTHARALVRWYVFVRTSMRLTRAAKAAHTQSKQNKQIFFDKIGIKQILLSAP